MRLLHWFGRNVGRFLLRLLAGDDAWRRFATQLRPGAFGGAERTPLALLQFRSTVPVKSASDVAAWLAGCKKVSSAEMRFGARTPMELASSLERDRQGNCQAHACWAFARLAQLHLNPTMVVGKWDETTTPGEFHVWVLFEENQRVFLMETMELALERAIQPFAAAKGHYRPLYAASASGASFVYRDYVHARLATPRNADDARPNSVGSD